jgi:hypothetical protein
VALTSREFSEKRDRFADTLAQLVIQNLQKESVPQFWIAGFAAVLSTGQSVRDRFKACGIAREKIGLGTLPRFTLIL